MNTSFRRIGKSALSITLSLILIFSVLAVLPGSEKAEQERYSYGATKKFSKIKKSYSLWIYDSKKITFKYYKKGTVKLSYDKTALKVSKKKIKTKAGKSYSFTVKGLKPGTHKITLKSGKNKFTTKIKVKEFKLELSGENVIGGQVTSNVTYRFPSGKYKITLDWNAKTDSTAWFTVHLVENGGFWPLEPEVISVRHEPVIGTASATFYHSSDKYYYFYINSHGINNRYDYKITLEKIAG
jgi:hypothetical protein